MSLFRCRERVILKSLVCYNLSINQQRKKKIKTNYIYVWLKTNILKNVYDWIRPHTRFYFTFQLCSKASIIIKWKCRSKIFRGLPSFRNRTIAEMIVSCTSIWHFYHSLSHYELSSHSLETVSSDWVRTDDGRGVVAEKNSLNFVQIGWETWKNKF